MTNIFKNFRLKIYSGRIGSIAKVKILNLKHEIKLLNNYDIETNKLE